MHDAYLLFSVAVFFVVGGRGEATKLHTNFERAVDREV